MQCPDGEIQEVQHMARGESPDRAVPDPQKGSPSGNAKIDRSDPAGDLADQADRLTMLFQVEAAHHAPVVDPPRERRSQDSETLVAQEDAADGSDDPMHAGGVTGTRWVSAEQAAMHVVDGPGGQTSGWLDDQTDSERADPLHDPFDGPPGDLTPEDQTLLGVDPYE